jgi:hypothetical protein
LINQKHTPNPCVIRCCLSPAEAAFLPSTLAGTRSQFRSFLSPLALTARFAATVPLLPAKPSFFWPQALLPFANPPQLSSSLMC